MPSSMRIDGEGGLRPPPPHVDGDDDALAAESLRGFADERRFFHGRRIERNLVRARTQDQLNILERPPAAADRERNVDGVRHAPHHVRHDVATVRRCGDVEKHQLVRAFFRVTEAALDRISGIPQFDKVDSFDDAAIFDIEAGNYAFCEHEITKAFLLPPPAPPKYEGGPHFSIPVLFSGGGRGW